MRCVGCLLSARMPFVPRLINKPHATCTPIVDYAALVKMHSSDSAAPGFSLPASAKTTNSSSSSSNNSSSGGAGGGLSAHVASLGLCGTPALAATSLTKVGFPHPYADEIMSMDLLTSPFLDLVKEELYHPLDQVCQVPVPVRERTM
jgi:hypothetical protein